MDIRGKRILVVGGAGLIGSHIVEELLNEDVTQVVIYDNFTRGTHENLEHALKDDRCTVFELGGDILHTDLLNLAVRDADAVVHLAALWLLHCHEFPRSAFEVNIQGTFNVLEACVANSVERLVYSSSASVYGNALQEPMPEDHPYNNETFYGATKIAGEHMFKAYHHRYGLSGAGLRYMNVYGPRQDYLGTYVSVIMKILDRLDAGKPPIVFGDGSQAYDFIHVRDVARANVCALKADVPFGYYNIGCGVKTTIKELTEKLLECTGSDLPFEYIPEGTTFVKNRIGSIDAARDELNFNATISLEEGLQSLIEWRASHKARQ